jgi:hypothetical protein
MPEATAGTGSKIRENENPAWFECVNVGSA